MYHFAIVPNLEKFQTSENFPLKKISIIIAACNEEKAIASALLSLLKQDYPDFEIIVVNDRSTDSTGAILEQLAKTDNRIKLVHIKTLPDGWLGKTNALHQASQLATGEWLLFTDADIHMRSDTLTLAMQYALSKQYDHLSLFPCSVTNNFLLQAMISTFRIMFLESAKPHKVSDPNTQDAIGLGAFNLVKKDIFKKSKGFEWLRLEVADDMGLALMLKQAGARPGFGYARKHITFSWYDTVGEMFKGLEKNLFPVGGHFKISRLIIIPMVLFLILSAPVVSLMQYDNDWIFTLGIFAYLLLFALSIFSRIYMKAAIIPTLLHQLGLILFIYMFIRSGFMCLKRGGIEWRGTVYPLDLMRKHQRVRR